MPPREEFPSGRAEGAPSDDIGWHFGTLVPRKNRNNVVCKYCARVITGGITRLKEHLAHMQGEVKGCARVSTFVRENMMKLLLDSKLKKKDHKRRKEEFMSNLRGDDDDDEVEGFLDEDAAMRQATRESVRSQRQWEDMQNFRRQTGTLDSMYEGGGRSRVGGSSGASCQQQRGDLERNLRSIDVDLTRSKSLGQPQIKDGVMKTLRKKLGEAVSKLIIYERLPMNLCNSPWFHNLLTEAAQLGKGVKCLTPYEVSEVYLEAEYKEMKKWIEELKPTWKDRGVTIMCDGWTNGINHMHIMNFLVYCSKGTVFLKSVDASNVASRNTDYYFQLLDKVVEEVGEENVVQVVTDNEKALKAAGLRLMEKKTTSLLVSMCNSLLGFMLGGY